jgi:hypothetical protein
MNRPDSAEIANLRRIRWGLLKVTLEGTFKGLAPAGGSA